MKTRIQSILRVGIGIALLSTILYLPAAATQSEIDEVKDNIDRLEGQQEESRQELEELQNDKAYLDGELLRINRELSSTAAELTGLWEQIAGKEADILKIQEELSIARLEEEKQYEDMKKRIRFFYEKGDKTVLEVLLEADSFADFINQAELVGDIYKYDRKMLEQYGFAKKEIAAREAQLLADKQELTALAARQQEKKDKVQELLVQVKKQAETAGEKIADEEKELAEYNERIKEQMRIEEELEAKKAEEEEKRQEENEQKPEELPPPVISDSESDLAMLAAIIECESGNESYEGKLAVGSVVMNRVRSTRFPNSVMEVIYQKGQFSPVASGRFATVLSRGAKSECVRAAKECLGGNLTLECLFFRRNNGTIEGIVIGNHVFY